MAIGFLKEPARWWVYVIRSLNPACGHLYVGCSVDPLRRLRQHNGEIKGGARYTTNVSRQPWRIERIDGDFTHQEALRMERQIKKRRGKQRLIVLPGELSVWKRLSDDALPEIDFRC